MNDEQRMLEILEKATAASQQGNWSLVNQYLQQLPLDRNAKGSAPCSDSELEQVLNLTLDVLIRGDFQERWYVAKLFPKLGQKAIAPLVEILEDDETELEVRWYAARILGEFNDPTAIVALVNLLETSEDEDLAAMAAEALASLGNSAVDALASLLSNPESRLLATTALSQIRNSATIAPLLGVVKDSDVTVRVTAIEALSSFHDSRVPPVLLDALNDPTAAVRKEAVTGLGLRSDLWEELDLFDRLKPLLYDFNRDVCQQAAIALGRSGTDEAAAALFEVIESPATPVPLQIDFVRALSWIRTAKALNYLQQAFARESAECAVEIIRVLGRYEQPTLKGYAAQILLDFFHSEHPARQEATVKQALGQAWGHLGEVRAVDALVELLADSDDSVRLHAIAALKRFPTAYQQLQQLAADETLKPELQAGVAIALAEWSIED